MKISLLCENTVSDMVWLAEWGFSAHMNYNGKNILFDTGFSDVYVKNADIAKIDLQDVDIVAVSHVHRDHTRGLLFHPFKSRKPLILHPRVLASPPTIKDDYTAADEYAAIIAKIREGFDVVEKSDCYEFVSGAFFLGEIPRVVPFEKGAYFDDSMPDDTALAFKTEKGAVVVSGCSHAGICNICEYSKEVTGQKLHAVVGGFHLLHNEGPPIDETISYFRDEQVELLAPMHCVEFDILARFHTELNTPKYSAGDVIVIC